MKKLFHLFVLVLLFGSCTEKDKVSDELKKETITLTQSDLVLIYFNGYLKGKRSIQNELIQNKLYPKLKYDSKRDWFIDSVEITNKFFPNH